jgi:hypothetical protein
MRNARFALIASFFLLPIASAEPEGTQEASSPDQTGWEILGVTTVRDAALSKIQNALETFRQGDPLCLPGHPCYELVCNATGGDGGIADSSDRGVGVVIATQYDPEGDPNWSHYGGAAFLC